MNAITASIQPVHLPQDIDAEQAVIGACLKDPAIIDAVAQVCGPADFYHTPHPKVFEAILSLHGDKTPATPLTVAARLAGDEPLAQCGGSDYLDAMRLQAPNDGILALARNLNDFRLRRDAIAAAEQCREALAQPAHGILDALKPVLDMADHAAQSIGKRMFVPVREAADAMLKAASDRAAGKAVVAATTGVNLLDETIGGLQGGDMIVMAGRPGMGKSALLMSTALRAAMEGRPALFFSLEMTQERLLQRIGCDLDFDDNPGNPISYSWFRNGTARHGDIDRLAQALTKLPDSLTIFENGSLDIQEIAALSRAHAARSDIMGVVVIDYLQKVSAGDRYRGNRVQEVTEISGAAKALAMRLKWPVVVGAQLNRGVESREEKRPALTDLRESGSIEQDADVVVGLYRPAYYIEKRKPATGQADPGYEAWKMEWDTDKNRLDLLVMKNRNGAEDSLSVFCDMRASAIRSDRPRGVA